MYTENTGKAGICNVEAALDRRFPGYTLEPNALGRYKHKSENSVIAHVLTHDKQAVKRAAAEICERNNQESVLCVELPVAWEEFVSSSSLRKKHRRESVSSSLSTRKSHSLSGPQAPVDDTKTLQQVERGL